MQYETKNILGEIDRNSYGTCSKAASDIFLSLEKGNEVSI